MNSLSAKLLFTSALSYGCSVCTAAEELPNFLIIVCEDISPYLNCFGDPVAITPNLDRFAQDAIRHNRMFTSVGVSAPSRYSLITGRYSSSDGANYMRSNYFNKEFGSIPPAGVKCYTEILRESGYYCTNNAKTDYQFNTPLAAWDEQGNNAHWKNAPADQPFLSIFNLNVTHESFIWKNSDKPLSISPDSVKIAPYHPDNQTSRHDYAVMYSNIQKMDQQFMQLLNELEKSERANNTIVIFYSDNGGPLPRAKRELMDSGTRVPFMIRFPDHRSGGTITNNLNMFVDIPATILSLAHINPPANMHGRAMYGDYTVKNTRKYVFGATDRFDEQIEKRGSIRSERYLYIRNYMPQQSVYRPVAFRLAMPMMRNMLELKDQGELTREQMVWFDENQSEELLFDCHNDPHQINNLAEKKEYKSVLNQMRKAYQKEWIKAYNQEWEKYPEDYFIRKMWPEGKKPKAELPRLKQKEGKVYVENDLTTYSAIFQINAKGSNGKSVHWNLYKAPISLEKGDVLTIRLERIGYAASEVISYSF
ncbi:MAG: sulfatase [Bacteroidales bacterium]